MPGLIDATCTWSATAGPEDGSGAALPGISGHFLARKLQEFLRKGVTTVRDIGSYGDQVIDTRQAMRYGAFRGPRVLTCGRIVSATAPGGRFFAGMYREADGADEVRRAVREQIRRGADFIKVMATGARTVELEAPDPIQLTRRRSRRSSRSPGASAIAWPPTRRGWRAPSCRRHGHRTIEHGMYLNRRPTCSRRWRQVGTRSCRPSPACTVSRAWATESGRTGARPRRPARRRAAGDTWSPCSSTSPTTTSSRPTRRSRRPGQAYRSPPATTGSRSPTWRWRSSG